LSQLEIAKLDVFVQNGIFGFGFGRTDIVFGSAGSRLTAKLCESNSDNTIPQKAENTLIKIR